MVARSGSGQHLTEHPAGRRRLYKISLSADRRHHDHYGFFAAPIATGYIVAPSCGNAPPATGSTGATGAT